MTPSQALDAYSLEAEGGIVARGSPVEEGFVVRAGSKAKVFHVESLKGDYSAIKEDLVRSGILVPNSENNAFVFTQDYRFKSSSAAASVVAGYQKSGPQSWKRSDGKLLKQVEAEEAGEDVKILETQV